MADRGVSVSQERSSDAVVQLGLPATSALSGTVEGALDYPSAFIDIPVGLLSGMDAGTDFVSLAHDQSGLFANDFSVYDALGNPPQCRFTAFKMVAWNVGAARYDTWYSTGSVQPLHPEGASISVLTVTVYRPRDLIRR